MKVPVLSARCSDATAIRLANRLHGYQAVGTKESAPRHVKVIARSIDLKEGGPLEGLRDR